MSDDEDDDDYAESMEFFAKIDAHEMEQKRQAEDESKAEFDRKLMEERQRICTEESKRMFDEARKCLELEMAMEKKTSEEVIETDVVANVVEEQYRNSDSENSCYDIVDWVEVDEIEEQKDNEILEFVLPSNDELPDDEYEELFVEKSIEEPGSDEADEFADKVDG